MHLEMEGKEKHLQKEYLNLILILNLHKKKEKIKWRSIININ
jgi:hypothetical protein